MFRTESGRLCFLTLSEWHLGSRREEFLVLTPGPYLERLPVLGDENVPELKIAMDDALSCNSRQGERQ